MRKDEFVSMITNKLAGGALNPDLKAKYHPRVIEMAIGRAFSQVIRETITKSSELDLYAKTFPSVEVHYSSDMDMYYSVLPEDTIQIQGKQQIRRIAHIKDRTLSFKPMDIGSEEVYSSLEAGGLGSFIGFNLVGRNVEYSWYPKTDTVLRVRMDLVIPFERYDDADEVHIPSGKDGQFLQLIDYYFNQIRPTDTLSDNNSKQIV